MLQAITGFLGAVFGFKQGATVANAAVGVANYGVLIAGGKYVLDHSAMQIDLGTISLGALSFVGLGVFVVIELLRRRAPGAAGADA